MGGLSIWHWLVVLIIVLAIFGTKRLTSGLSGGAKDLGSAVKEFKKALRDEEAKPVDSKVTDPLQPAIDPAKLAVIEPTHAADGSAVVRDDDKSPRG